jgi:hypothetical protein
MRDDHVDNLLKRFIPDTTLMCCFGSTSWKKIAIDKYSISFLQFYCLMLLWVYIHTRQAETLAWPRCKSNPMLCQLCLSYEANSVRVCGISELSLVPSIPMWSMTMIMIFFVCFDVQIKTHTKNSFNLLTLLQTLFVLTFLRSVS